MKEIEINLKEKKKADAWVKDKPKIRGRMIRLTIDITPELHQKLKLKCVMERSTIADIVRGLLEEKVRDQSA
jgi:hypothetical protein